MGVDVGGTKILAIAVDEEGTEIARVRRPTGWGPDAVGDEIARAVAELESVLGVVLGPPVGIGIPGQIVPDTGVVEHAVNLGIERFGLADAVAARIGRRPVVDNDVRAAALGAAALLPDLFSLAYLNLGTGIAAAVVDETGLRRGPRGAAGEIGHLSVDPAGPPCRCGQRGCIESLAGGGSVAERWGMPAELPVLDVFDAADAGIGAAARIRADVVRGVAAAVQLLILSADVDAVVLGGGVAALGDRLAVPVRERLRATATGSPFLRSLRLEERVTAVPGRAPVGALGAALLARTAHPAAPPTRLAPLANPSSTRESIGHS
ncbi:ROK family protein [Microbacterium radiodurans]|uniref:ROK family protein n=1 Tax=Microbacterium radiodurans TaxID=661398 RepID=A0A5J5IPF5_9MICO|nr:ROK family protein [Microbacterium radiodurans]